MSIVIFACLILGFLSSCAPETSSANDRGDSVTNQQSGQTEGDLNNQSFVSEITSGAIDSVSDFDLPSLILEHLYQKLPPDYTQEYASVMSWNPSERAIFVILALKGEVDNGGFNQYYYNSSGEYAKVTPEALRLINAPEFADLSERANAVYEKKHDEITKEMDGTIEGFSKSYENNPLNAFDDEFYRLDSNDALVKLIVRYIRTHKEDFLDK